MLDGPGCVGTAPTASTGSEPAVTASSRITLARGTISSNDELTVELIQPPNMPPAVLIWWPAAPSVLAPNPKEIANVASAIVKAMAEAQARLAKIGG